MTLASDTKTLFDLSGKIALVTGASRGLGKSMAIGLAEAGADVGLVSSTGANLEDTKAAIKDLGRKVICFGADMTDRQSIASLVTDMLETYGHIDILVNNAGTIRRAPAHEYSDEDWLHVIEANLNGLFFLSRDVGRHMLERRKGKIINIASLLSFSGGITVPAYAASKGGVAQLTKALANEWAKSNIQVNAIAPGYFATDNTTALRADEKRNSEITARIPAGIWGDPDDLKGPVVFLASEASNYVNGHIMLVDGGWMAR